MPRTFWDDQRKLPITFWDDQRKFPSAIWDDQRKFPSAIWDDESKTPRPSFNKADFVEERNSFSPSPAFSDTKTTVTMIER